MGLSFSVYVCISTGLINGELFFDEYRDNEMDGEWEPPMISEYLLPFSELR